MSSTNTQASIISNNSKTPELMLLNYQKIKSKQNEHRHKSPKGHQHHRAATHLRLAAQKSIQSS